MLTILPTLFCITTSQCLVTPKFSLVSCLGECRLCIDLALRQFLAMNSVGSGLVNYSCYMDDICSIFELDLPWTKPYLAFILFSRLCKGFQPRLSFWKEDLEDAEENGMVLFVRECLQGTSRIKSRVKQLITPLEGRECCEADLLLDEWMKKHRFSPASPLSYYQSTGFTGVRYVIKGEVQRAFLCRSVSSASITSEDENEWLKECCTSVDPSDASGIFAELQGKAKGKGKGKGIGKGMGMGAKDWEWEWEWAWEWGSAKAWEWEWEWGLAKEWEWGSGREEKREGRFPGKR